MIEFQNITQKTRNWADRTSAYLSYEARRIVHRPYRPVYDLMHQRILNDVQFDGVSALALDDLNLSATDKFKTAAEKALLTLDGITSNSGRDIGYDEGFEHCIPLSPAYIAEHYPDIYMWGLDSKLLNLMEAMIGLPPLYHGVLLRRELVDNKAVGTRLWHTDFDDHDIIRICVYLTDVLEPDDGAFEYIPRTVKLRWADFETDIITDSVMREKVPQWMWKQVTGPKWSVSIKAVSKIFHRGRVPQTPRAVASFYYTSRKPAVPAIAEAFSFKSGLPKLSASMTERQLQCLGGYRDLLP